MPRPLKLGQTAYFIRNRKDSLLVSQTMAEHVSAGRTGPLPESRPAALKRRWGFYNVIGMTFPDPVVRLGMPKPKLYQSACDQCWLCAKECPMDNISMQPYPVLGGQCIRCYRCITCCNQKAFSANFLMAKLSLGFIYSVTFSHWFGDLEPGESAY